MNTETIKFKNHVNINQLYLLLLLLHLSWTLLLIFFQKRQAEEDKENAEDGAEVGDMEDMAGKQKENLGKATTTVRGKKRQRSGKSSNE